MKTSKRTTAILLAALLILSTTVPALAASGGAAADAAAAEPSAAPGETTAAGDGEPSEKEEVIYVTLDASGELVSAYAVNSFPGGEITDYGDYDSVRVLNTGDEIEYKDGIVNNRRQAHLLPGRTEKGRAALGHLADLQARRQGRHGGGDSRQERRGGDTLHRYAKRGVRRHVLR